MKLRNKKTKVIVDVDFQVPMVCHNGELLGWYKVENLNELNESFEDYTPTEPLIKDEKIRKLVSDWAKLTRTTRILTICRRTRKGEEFTEFFGEESCISLEILGRFDWVDMKEYTITELCGEEEE